MPHGGKTAGCLGISEPPPASKLPAKSPLVPETRNQESCPQLPPQRPPVLGLPAGKTHNFQRHAPRYCGLLAGVVLILVGTRQLFQSATWVQTLMQLGVSFIAFTGSDGAATSPATEIQSGGPDPVIAADVDGSNKSEFVAPVAATLLERVTKTLSCEASRGVVLDILAGAPYEFGGGVLVGDAFQRLPRLVARAARQGGEQSSVEVEVRDLVLQLASLGGGWPPALRDRILRALDASCEAPAGIAERAGRPQLSLEVDTDWTSLGAISSGSGWLHQRLLDAGALTGFSALQRRAESCRSRPAGVVVELGQPVAGDCFAVRGNASVALRVMPSTSSALQDATLVHAVVVEQPPRWTIPNLGSSPRRFAVYGEPWTHTANLEATIGTAGPYRLPLGSFEYMVAGPAAQTFVLERPRAVKGLQFLFESPGWGGQYKCIYRLRAFGSIP